MKRTTGILMHISSLPGEYSIGSFGKEAKEFVDFLANGGFSYWQTLPFCIRKCNIIRYNKVPIWRASNLAFILRISKHESSMKVPQIKPILSPIKHKERVVVRPLFR